MCGIAGIFNPSGPHEGELQVRRMLSLIGHRGPDDEGVWAGGPVVLGHKRLSILDLTEKGRNPMADPRGAVRIVYNGEIYNFRELREDLKRQGHRFFSETDTEVVLALYLEDGERCVERLNGMFAFAIWDEPQQKLFLARDRFGVKPLYYTQMKETFAFASEIKAFLSLPKFCATPNLKALYEQLAFQNFLGDKTLFEGVKILPQGHTLVLQGEKQTTRLYWDLCFDPDETLTEEDWARGIRGRFESAVERQLVSDVPLGSFLSGGMDTGSIAAVAARKIPRMHTFTCGFDLPKNSRELEKYFDESAESLALAALLKTRHLAIRLGSDTMKPVLPQVVWYLDEPRAGISYPVFYMSREIRRYVKVVLSGVGGDELFAGYPWKYEPLLNETPESFPEKFYQITSRLLDDRERRQLLSKTSLSAIGDFNPRDSFGAILKNTAGMNNLHAALYFDFKTFLHALLLVEDKLNMAHSVESRVPFLDNDFIDYVSRIPSRLRLKGGQGKWILRKAMAGLLPEATLERRKQGFTPPDQTWYKSTSFSYIRELLLGKRAADRGYFNPAFLEKILNDHLNNRRNHRFLIWSLISFEWWNRLFVDGERHESIRDDPRVAASVAGF